MARYVNLKAIPSFVFTVAIMLFVDANVLAGPARLGSGFVSSIAFSPDGTTLAAAHRTDPASDMDHTQVAILWDPQTQEQIEVLDIDNIGVIAFAPDGRLLALGNQGGDNNIHLWDVVKRVQIGVIQPPQGLGVLSISFSPDGEVLASSSFGDNAVRLWNVQTQESVGVLTEPVEDPWAVAFSLDGRWLASGGHRGDEAIRLWDIETKEQAGELMGHLDMTLDLAFSPDGTLLASAGGIRDKAVYLWDVETQNQVGALAGHTAHVGSIAFTPSGKYLASTVYWDDSIHIWDIETQEQLALLTDHDATDFGHADEVVFSLDGKWLACGSEDGVELWQLDQPREMLIELMLLVMSEFHQGNIDAEPAWSSLVIVQTALVALDEGNPDEVHVAMSELATLISEEEGPRAGRVSSGTAEEIVQRAHEILVVVALGA